MKKISVSLIFICIISLLASCVGKTQGLSFSASNDTAKAVYAYLCSVEGEKCLSAQQESTWMDSTEYEMDYIFSSSGKYPAMRGLDYMNDDFEGVNERAYNWWQKGGLVTICWHTGSDFSGAWKESMETEITDWNKALTKGTDEYNALIKGMDKAAKALSELKEKGVTVIWRPFHEADGGWFWWGKGKSSDFRKLWRIMYERYTVYWQLDNLIWVQGFSHNGEKLNQWYVGDAYCDIIGADSYDGNAQPDLYKAVKKVRADGKPVCFHECGENPTAEQLKETKWLWFMTWHTEYLVDNNPKETVNELYNSEYVITLDELPDFRKGKKQMTDTNPASLRVENVLDTLNWLGKEQSEIDVPTQYIKNDSSYGEINFSGLLFSEECHGTAHFGYLNTEEDSRIEKIVIFIDNYTYDKCKSQFISLYGEPVSEDEEPYAEAIGGVVTHTFFETANLKITMESASNYSFYTVEFKLINAN